jgi:hypothetical protein
MINKINNNQIQNIQDKSLAKQYPEPAKTAPNNADISLQVDHVSLMEKALQVPQDDTTAVEKAKKLLESGELENIENIRTAAENIIKFGI